MSTSLNISVIMRNSEELSIRPSRSQDRPAQEFLENASAQRVDTDAVIAEAIREQYPHLHLTITPENSCNLLSYAAAGHASVVPIAESSGAGSSSTSLKWRRYAPPGKRMDNQPGVLYDQIIFGKYTYSWKNYEFILYIVDGRDGTGHYPMVKNNYILSKSEEATNELIVAASQYEIELHDEIYVFEQGRWQKSKELWHSAQKAEWKDVILDVDMKKAIVEDVQKFFNSRKTYTNLGVPWKRGIIYYGPPGKSNRLGTHFSELISFNMVGPFQGMGKPSVSRPQCTLSITEMTQYLHSMSGIWSGVSHVDSLRSSLI